MLYRVFADLVVMVHLAFVLFAVLGGLLVLRWKRCAWLHVPAVVWAALIEFAGWVCPLTGAIAYRSGFVEHYILPLLYPAVLTRRLQIVLGLFVLGVNLGIYGWVLYRTYKGKR